MHHKNSMTSRPFTRRDFLKTSALATAAAFPTIIPARVLGANAPSKRVNLGFIGAGAISHNELSQFLQLDNCRVTASCDVRVGARESHRNAIVKAYTEKFGAGNFPEVRLFHDFNELLAQPDIDAVYIGTPDHWHVPMALKTLQAGKDLRLQKPLGVSVEQALAFEKAMAGSDRVFGFGTQYRAKEAGRLFVEVLWNGHLGKLTDVVLVGMPGVSGGDPTPQPVPAGFDYDRWLGPAPEKPHTKDRVTRPGIFNIYDYTLGFFSNVTVHDWDIFQRWANIAGIGVPVEYQGTGEMATGGLFDCPLNWHVTGKYANGLRFHFVDRVTAEKVVPEVTGEKGDHIKYNSLFVVGENGNLLGGAGGVGPWNIAHKCKTAAGQQRLPVVNNTFADFVDCVLSRQEPISDWRSAVDDDLVFQLSDIAIRSGKKVVWDPVNKTVVGDSGLVSMMSRPMREPFSLQTIMKQ